MERSCVMLNDMYDSGHLFMEKGVIVFPNSILTIKEKPIVGLQVEGINHVLVKKARDFWPPPLAKAICDEKASLA